jgi:hypothetical protein
VVERFLILLFGLAVAMAITDPNGVRKENAQLKAENAQWRRQAAPLVAVRGWRVGEITPEVFGYALNNCYIQAIDGSFTKNFSDPNCR